MEGTCLNIFEPEKAQSDYNDIKYWLAFSQVRKIGPARFGKISSCFPDLKTAWESRFNDWLCTGFDHELIQEIILCKNQINPDRELERLEKEGIKVLKITDNKYPRLLKQIYNPPFLLYYRGEIEAVKINPLAIVGTRKFSPYGKQVAEDFSGALASSGLCIVSGLALGIDAIAHLGALKAEGRTAAVLGSSLETQNIYPSSNRYLANKIIDSGGCLISDFPLGTNPSKITYPQRNRIISGLSYGVLVIEAPEPSGSLITAYYALEQNREVFAVPGNIYNQGSQGTIKLIKQGAKTVSKPEDVIEELKLNLVINKERDSDYFNLNLEESLILAVLSKEPLHVDKIAKSCKLGISVLSGSLSLLEMKGYVRDLGGKNYIKL